MGTKKIILGLVLGLLLIFVSNVSAVTYIDNCQSLTEDNTVYKLTQDVESDRDCFSFYGNNITFDGQGHTVTFAKVYTGTAFTNNANGGIRDIVIKNTRIISGNTTNEDYIGTAIDIGNLSSVVIENNTMIVDKKPGDCIRVNVHYFAYPEDNFGRDFLFKDNDLTCNGSAIRVEKTDNITAKGNNIDIVRNAFYSEWPIATYKVIGTQAIGNTIESNGTWINLEKSSDIDFVNNTYSYYNENEAFRMTNVTDIRINSNYFYNDLGGPNILLLTGADNNQIWNNIFDIGYISDSGTGNIYCVDGVGNEYINGAFYSGPDPNCGSCECPPVPSAIYIDSCQTLNQENMTYILTQDIINYSGTCFEITANNVTLDCEGHMVDGNETGYTAYDFGYNDIVIKNCSISDFDYAFHFQNSENIEIKNSDVVGKGFEFYEVDGIKFVNNTVDREAYSFFNNVSNAIFTGNTFNKTVERGDQIIHANDYIWNLTFNDNRLEGICLYSSFLSIYNTLHNVSIYGNWFNTSCTCVTLGYKHDDINPNFPSGRIEVYDNEFNMWNESAYYVMRSYAWGDDASVSIHDNTFNGNGRYSLRVYPRGNLDDISVYNNRFEGSSDYVLSVYDVENLLLENNVYDEEGNIYPIYLRNLDNAIVNNETIITPSQYYGIYLWNTSAHVTNSEFRGVQYDGARVHNYNVPAGYFKTVNFENCEFYGNRSGITTDYNATSNVYHSIVDGMQDDVLVRLDGTINLYNTSIDSYNVTSAYGGTGILNVYWQLTANNPLGSMVKIYDKLGGLISEFSDISRTLWLREYYVLTENNKTYTTHHTIEAAKEGYWDLTTDITMDDNKEIILNLNPAPPKFVYTDNCMTLDQENTIYVLTQDITNHSGTCFEIAANNVTLDCDGYIINGNSSYYGILVDGYDDTKVMNCEFVDWAISVKLNNTDNVLIYNASESGSMDSEFLFYDSNNVIIEDSDFNYHMLVKLISTEIYIYDSRDFRQIYSSGNSDKKVYIDNVYMHSSNIHKPLYLITANVEVYNSHIWGRTNSILLRNCDGVLVNNSIEVTTPYYCAGCATFDTGTGSNVNITNSIVMSRRDQNVAIRVFGNPPSHVNLLNVTYDYIWVATGNVSVYWYADFYTFYDDTPLNETNLTIIDSKNSSFEYQLGSETNLNTNLLAYDVSGYASNYDIYTNYYPYTVYAEREGYGQDTETFNLTGNIELLFNLNPASSSLYIDGCRALNQQNRIYLLTKDVTGYSGTCFPVSANNLTLDCNGHTLDANITKGQGVPERPLFVYSDGYDDIEVRNCNLIDADYLTIIFKNGENISVHDNNFSSLFSNGGGGVHSMIFRDGRGAEVYNNIITNSESGGIALVDKFNDTEVYNNFLENVSTPEGTKKLIIARCMDEWSGSGSAYMSVVYFRNSTNGHVHDNYVNNFTGSDCGGQYAYGGDYCRIAGCNWANSPTAWYPVGIHTYYSRDIIVENNKFLNFHNSTAYQKPIQVVILRSENVKIKDNIFGNWQSRLKLNTGPVYFINQTYVLHDILWLYDWSYYRMWYFDLTAENDEGNPLSEANVAIKDIYDNTVFSGYTTMDGTSSTALIGYFENSTDKINYYPYTVYAQKEGYVPATDIFNLTGNTQLTLKLGLSLKPDLTFVNWIQLTNENPMENESIDVTVTVKNIGNETGNETVVKFYDNDQLFATRSVGSLNPGETETIVQVFSSSVEGLHFIRAVVDLENLIAEWNEDNNEIIRVVYVGEITEIGNIIVDGYLSPSEGYRGSIIRVHGTATYNTTFGAGTKVKGAEVTINLLENEWTARTDSNGYFGRYIQIPIDAPYGMNDVNVFVTDFTLTGQKTLDLNVIPPPPPPPNQTDIAIYTHDISVAPSRLVESENATLYVRVRNVGTLDVYNVTVDVYKDGEPFVSETVPYLAKGSSQTLSFLMEDLNRNWFNIRAVLDEENEINESNENNNVAERDFFVYGPDDIDLIVSDIWPSKIPFVGENLTLYVKVLNYGEENASNITVRISDGPEKLGNVTIENLGRLENKTISVPWEPLYGWWHIIKAEIIEFFNEGKEVFPHNNVRAEYIYVYSTAPDLRILSEDIYFSNPNPYPGETITIYVDVTNIGDENASEFMVRVSEDFTEYTVELGEEAIDSLAIGERKTISVNYSTNLSGSHVIMAEADPYGELIERYLHNNKATRAIVVKWPCIDEDGDGYGVCPNCNVTNDCTYDGNDCDDTDTNVNPGATEVCNGIDDNCDNQTDENLVMECGEGVCLGTQTCSAGVWSDCSSYGSDAGVCALCDTEGTPVYDDAQDYDCDATVCPEDGCGVDICGMNIWGDYPDYVPNECSSIYACTQNTCDGTAVCGPDNDSDGWGPECGDCNDYYNLTYPGAPEICEGMDNDCDNQTDEGYLDVEAILIKVERGNRPNITREPIVGMEVRAFNKSVGSCAKNIGTSWQHYGDIWENCTEQQSCVTDSNGTCMMEISEGDYIVIGKHVENSNITYTASMVGNLSCGEERYTRLIIKEDARGKRASAKQTKRTGSLLYIIEPEYVLWDSETESYPFIFESVGNWEITVTVNPPEGFVSDYDSMSDDVNTNIKAVQFYITDIGSKWVPTEVEYEIKHKDKKEKIKTKIGVAMSKELAKEKDLDKKEEREKKGFTELEVFE